MLVKFSLCILVSLILQVVVKAQDETKLHFGHMEGESVGGEEV